MFLQEIALQDQSRYLSHRLQDEAKGTSSNLLTQSFCPQLQKNEETLGDIDNKWLEWRLNTCAPVSHKAEGLRWILLTVYYDTSVPINMKHFQDEQPETECIVEDYA